MAVNRLQRLYDLGARKIIVVNVGPIGCIPYERDTNRAAGDCCFDPPNEMAQLFNARLRDLVSELSSTLQGSKLVYADIYRIVDDIIENYASYGEIRFYNSRVFSFHFPGKTCLQGSIGMKIENTFYRLTFPSRNRTGKSCCARQAALYTIEEKKPISQFWKLSYARAGFENADSSCCYIAGNYGGLLPCGPPSNVCSDRSKYIFWDPYHPSDAANIIIAKRLMDGGLEDIHPMNIRQLAES